MKIIWLSVIAINIYYLAAYGIKIGLLMLMLGATLNILVTRANGGKMPVWSGSIENSASLMLQIELEKMRHGNSQHELITPKTRLKPLCDWVCLGKHYTCSIGDILMAGSAWVAVIETIKH